MRGACKTHPVPEHQADAYVDQAAPVSGTKYEWSSDGTQTKKLGSLKNVRIIAVYVKVTWTVQPTPLEVHITVDGHALTFIKVDPVSATQYQPVLWANAAENAGFLEAEAAIREGFLLEGRSVKIECETTGGTVSHLDMRIKYAKW